MKDNLTELVFILDRSGSMSGLEKDTIGGFTSMLTKQKALDGQCRITTVLFNNHYTLLHDRIDIQAVSPMTEKEYFVGGSTALLDAIGRTIQKLVHVQKNTAENYRAAKVMFIIITDGEENSSREYSSDKIKTMIEHEKEKYGWEFCLPGREHRRRADCQTLWNRCGPCRRLCSGLCRDHAELYRNVRGRR
ncbi:MAG: vWA domain-containing protein [Blautia sp.]